MDTATEIHSDCEYQWSLSNRKEAMPEASVLRDQSSPFWNLPSQTISHQCSMPVIPDTQKAQGRKEASLSPVWKTSETCLKMKF